MDLWSPFEINSVRLPNRFMHSAAGEGLSTPEGAPTTRWLDRYRTLGRGGAIGLIMTGHTYVHKSAKVHEGMAGIDEDSLIPTYKKFVTVVKRDGSRFFLQLAHAGLLAHKRFSGYVPAGPGILNLPGAEETRAMTIEDIQKVPVWFAHAARRARESGFDGVQIHAAHGYLLCEFLSPYFNHRTDDYGGSPENRARLAVEVVRAIRREVGSDYPVLMKLNALDLLEGGISLEESLEQARLIRDAGTDVLEVSAGFGYSFSKDGNKGPMRLVNPKTFKGALYNASYSGLFREKLAMPIIAVGGVRTFQHAQDVLDKGYGDLVSLCRPLIREPDLILRWKHGIYDNSTCLSCNKCCQALRTPLGLHCAALV